jgi:hypothetical protein
MQHNQPVLKCPVTTKWSAVKKSIRYYGWKTFLGFFLFYLIRDVTLYIVLPYVILY